MHSLETSGKEKKNEKKEEKKKECGLLHIVLIEPISFPWGYTCDL